MHATAPGPLKLKNVFIVIVCESVVGSRTWGVEGSHSAWVDLGPQS